MKMETLEKFTLNNNTTDSDKLRIVSWQLPHCPDSMELFIKRLTRNNPNWDVIGANRSPDTGFYSVDGFRMVNKQTGTEVEFDGIQNQIIWNEK